MPQKKMNTIKKSKYSKSELLIYQIEDGQTQIQVQLEGGTVWLSQKLMANLFQKAVHTINEHIHNIYTEKELDKKSTIRKFRIVQNEGSRTVVRTVDFYNLKIIIAVGYRVKSHIGTQFRRWATDKINEYLVKGFVMDDERLKSGYSLGIDYFDELLERIRDIRASEKRFYQKIKDIYSLSVDYNPKSQETQSFFKNVQNKLHWSITGQTASEIIKVRASAQKPNMGLTTWSGKKVRKHDVVIAKNYLKENEIKRLNRLVNMYLDYAESQAEERIPMTMKDWKDKLESFLLFNRKDILKHSGKITNEMAESIALKEYKKFNKQRIQSKLSIKELEQIVDPTNNKEREK